MFRPLPSPGSLRMPQHVTSPCSTWSSPHTAKDSFPGPCTYIRASSTWQHLLVLVKCSGFFSVCSFSTYLRGRKRNGKNNSVLTGVSPVPLLPTDGAVWICEWWMTFMYDLIHDFCLYIHCQLCRPPSPQEASCKYLSFHYTFAPGR